MMLKRVHAAAAVAPALVLITLSTITPPVSSFSANSRYSSLLQWNAGFKVAAPIRGRPAVHDRPTTTALHLVRYGPRDDDVPPEQLDENFWNEQEEWEKSNNVRVEAQKVNFHKLLDDILNVQDPDHLPGIMTRNVDLLLSMRGYEGVTLLKDAIEEARQSGDDEYVKRVTAASDYVLSFVEEFVGQAKQIDDGNKALLGKIVRAITSGWDGKDGSRPGPKEEALLDDLFEREKGNFTPGFLRHLEGECNRIASAQRLSPESAKMLQTMRLIQTRVVEELGKELGEGAVVLGELVAYENRSERLAVLDAGLTVRGVDFATELAKLTEEALDGFQRVPGGADPGLVRIVTEIDDRIKSFIEKSKSFQ